MLKYFLEYSTTFVAKYLHASDALIYVLVSLLRSFELHYLLLYVVYICQKSLNFVDAFNCYKQK